MKTNGICRWGSTGRLVVGTVASQQEGCEFKPKTFGLSAGRFWVRYLAGVRPSRVCVGSLQLPPTVQNHAG